MTARRFWFCIGLSVAIAFSVPPFVEAQAVSGNNQGNGPPHEGIFMTKEDEGFELPRINPAFIVKPGQVSENASSLKDSLKYHEIQELRVRTLLEEKVGKRARRGRARQFGQARFQKMVRKDFGRKEYARWMKYTEAMKTLLAHDKCGPVWNQATNLYYICCVFRVGLDDVTPYSSCLVPMSVGEIEPSPEDGLHAKYSVQYGFNDVMDSLPEESRAEVRKDFDDMSNVEAGMSLLSEEGDFETEIMSLVKRSSDNMRRERRSRNDKGKNSELADDLEENEIQALSTTLLDMLVSHEQKKFKRGTMRKKRYSKMFNKLERALRKDIKTATSCAAEASKRYQLNTESAAEDITTAYQDELETVLVGCQKTLSRILAKHRENVYEIARKNSAEFAGDNGTVLRQSANESRALTSSVRQSTRGIWQYDYYSRRWIWVFSYSYAPVQTATRGSACSNSRTAAYSLCCDSVMAMTSLCYALTWNAY